MDGWNTIFSKIGALNGLFSGAFREYKWSSYRLLSKVVVVYNHPIGSIVLAFVWGVISSHLLLEPENLQLAIS